MSVEILSSRYFQWGQGNNAALAFDSNDNLYIADIPDESPGEHPHRILYYQAGEFEVSRVYGGESRGRFVARRPNRGERLTMPRALGGISAKSLDYPVALALDSEGNLYVAERENHRVLFFPNGSTEATRVYGQGGDFQLADYNHGTPDSGRHNPLPTAETLAFPVGLALDSEDNLYVADSGNNRVLMFSGGSTTATRVYGQKGNFSGMPLPCEDLRDTPQEVRRTGGMRYIGPGVSAECLTNSIGGIAVDSRDNLYVLDGNRILFYAKDSTEATRVYGQDGSFTSNLVNVGGERSAGEMYRKMSPDGFREPSGLALDANDNLYVTDAQNGRIVLYPRDSTKASRFWTMRRPFVLDDDGQVGLPFRSPRAPAFDHKNNLYVIDDRLIFILEAVDINPVFVKRFCPQFNFHPMEKFFPCSIEYLLHNSTLKDRQNPDFEIVNPTQQDLYTYWDGKERYYVEINPSQNSGGDQRVLYYSVKRVGSGDHLEIEITYILLYAWQGGQAARVDPVSTDAIIGAEVGAPVGALIALGSGGPLAAPFGAVGGALIGGAVGEVAGSVWNAVDGFIEGSDNPTTTNFTTIISNYGEHQGDLERVTVRLRQGGETKQDFQIVHATYEHHGDPKTYDFNYFYLVEDTHPVAGVGLGQHPTYNPVKFGGRGEIYVLVESYYVVVLVDIISDGGKQWQPWNDDTEIIEVGIFAGEPINDQVWAKFNGRFGVVSEPSLQSATYLNGDNLITTHWAALEAIGKQIEPTGKIPTENGPNGVNGRDFKTLKPERFEVKQK